MRVQLSVWLLILAAVIHAGAQENSESARRKAFDQVLDLYVRDGMVYYRTLKSERAKLDGYVSALANVTIDSAPREEQLAFWLNAYNALVLQTVVNHYPIAQRSSDYPAHSIRQIPGAFERTPHRVAGRTVTLDQIEQTILSTFKDPRVFLAIGRGAMGSGRLRSEPFAPETLETQLAEAAAECATRTTCLDIDRTNNQVNISSIFSWRSQDFVAEYSEKSRPIFATRSPIERSVLAFVEPKLLTTEKEFLEKNEFKVVYKPFDWNLNDLTGRGGR
jgi:hypothetical protein